MNIKKITALAMLVGLYVVLSILTPIKLNNFKFTFEAFPILIAGFLYGPLGGFTVGTLGSSLYQVLFSGYGITLTTIFWILPHSISGLVVGLLAKNKRYQDSTLMISIIGILSSIIVTALNTVALYIDSKVNGYYSAALVFSSLPIKLLIGIILAIIYALLLPTLIKAVKKN